MPAHVVSEPRCFKHTVAGSGRISQHSLAQKLIFTGGDQKREEKKDNTGLESMPLPELDKLSDNIQT